MRALQFFFGTILLAGVIFILIISSITDHIDVIYTWGEEYNVALLTTGLLIPFLIGAYLVYLSFQHYFSFLSSKVDWVYTGYLKQEETILLVTWWDRPFVVSRISNYEYKIEDPFNTRFQKGQVIRLKPKRLGVKVENCNISTIMCNDYAVINNGTIGELRLFSPSYEFVNVRTKKFEVSNHHKVYAFCQREE